MSEQESSRSSIVLHMLPRSRWKAQPLDQPYAGDTLATEGFIHCTAEPAVLERVANTRFREQAGDWVILQLDTARVSAPVRWELSDGHIFPHIYGPIELEAVIQVLDFPRNRTGDFRLPPVLAHTN